MLQEQIANAAEFLGWAKDWIDDAVKTSPEATLAWTVICIGLPFLTKPAAADKANLDGFKYVSSRMRYYVALESLLEARDPTTNPVPEDLKHSYEANVIELYQQILGFQIKSVLRYYKSSLTRFVRDIRGKDNWTEMRAAIEDLEQIIYKDAQQISSLSSGRRLEELAEKFRRLEFLARDAAASLKTMQNMLALEQQHLKVSEHHRDISAKQLEAQRELIKLTRKIANMFTSEGKKKANILVSEEKRYHLLFRVTSKGQNEGDYEWYKNRIEPRVEGTCEWFLEHPKYKTWKSESCGPLLVSADAGCGKSVLAKHLIDYELQGESTVCYFFFKDQDQNSVQQALRALLHQLLVKRPILDKHVGSEYQKNGDNLVNITSSLWKIFEGAIEDEQAGSIIFVLDALDECAESDLKDLIKMLKRQFISMQNSTTSKIKFLLTSRPYEQIMADFRDLVDYFPYVRIPGEEASEQISKEVNHVIEHRVRKLAKDQGLNSDVEEALRKRLLRVQHRTYLWVYLVFKYIEEQGLEKRTPQGVKASLATLPNNVNEAYENILSKVTPGHQKWVEKTLRIIVAAASALTLEEMNVAVNVDTSAKFVLDLDLEDEQTFANRLRHWCGLFVSIYGGRVYLLHQTAREFLTVSLLPSELDRQPPWRWRRSMDMDMAHTTIAEICVTYLTYSDFSTEKQPIDSDNEEYRKKPRRPKFYMLRQFSKFLIYAVQHWITHYHSAGPCNRKILASSALKLLSLRGLKAERNWFTIYSHFSKSSSLPPVSCDGLIIASYFGLDEVIELLLHESDPNVKEGAGNHYSALHWATMNERDTTVKLLLDGGADPDIRDFRGMPPLMRAVETCNISIIGLLLEKGANVDAPWLLSSTPLHIAAVKRGSKAPRIVQMLLRAGADLNKENFDGLTPLQLASREGISEVQKLLEDAVAENTVAQSTVTESTKHEQYEYSQSAPNTPPFSP